MKKKWYDDSFWHRKYVDLWTIPHILFGTIPSLICLLTGFDLLYGFILTIVVAILWEIGEMVIGVWTTEVFSNKITDVLVAGIWYGTIWAWNLLIQPGWEAVQYVLIIVVILQIMTSIIGWIGYQLWHKK
jgi:hypothetical protein